MPVIRWIGKTLSFVGDIMSAEGVDEYLTEQGKKATKVIVAKFASRHVAVEEGYKQLAAKTGAFRSVFEKTLATLPQDLLSIAKDIKDKGIDALWNDENFLQIFCVPRDLLLSRFTQRILTKFSHSAQLADFPGLLHVALSRTAANNESAFFAGQKSDSSIWAEKNNSVIGIDDSTVWRDDKLPGHYYLAEYVSRSGVFESEARRKLPKLVDKVGDMSVSQRDQILNQLYPPAVKV